MSCEMFGSQPAIELYAQKARDHSGPRQLVSAVELDKNNFEEELETVGENMKNLESSAEKALEREEKLVEKILSLQNN